MVALQLQLKGLSPMPPPAFIALGVVVWVSGTGVWHWCLAFVSGTDVWRRASGGIRMGFGVWCQVSGDWCQASGDRRLVCGVWRLASDVWALPLLLHALAVVVCARAVRV